MPALILSRKPGASGDVSDLLTFHMEGQLCIQSITKNGFLSPDIRLCAQPFFFCVFCFYVSAQMAAVALRFKMLAFDWKKKKPGVTGDSLGIEWKNPPP